MDLLLSAAHSDIRYGWVSARELKPDRICFPEHTGHSFINLVVREWTVLWKVCPKEEQTHQALYLLPGGMVEMSLLFLS